MKLFLDCEWNGEGGELISLALVPIKTYRPPFYGALPLPVQIDPWVKDHVVPFIGEPKEYRTTYSLGEAMCEWLRTFRSVHVIADWPEDIARFCRLLLTRRPGVRYSTPRLRMSVIRIDSTSATPHNALADAKALRQAYIVSRKQITAKGA